MATAMTWKSDPLARLGERGTLTERLEAIHKTIRTHLPRVDRMAVALLDLKAAELRTFLHSSGGPSPLLHYTATLAHSPTLREVVEQRKIRVVDDLQVFAGSEAEHTKRILAEGYRSSAALPFFRNGRPFGVLFYDSRLPGTFDDDALADLAPYGHLVAELIGGHLERLQAMLSSLRTAIGMVHWKDPETGNHLERMAGFSQLIARELARSSEHPLTDEDIEYLFAFAPLHDVGKIATPDRILQKPGRLDPEEAAVMRDHARRGRQVVDSILADFGFDAFPHADVLRHVTELHHEKLDGSGYPEGLSERDIPLEARIVAVSDVFDALTSKRPYKNAWTNEEALDHLWSLAGVHYDAACLSALDRRLSDVEAIQARYRDSG